MKKILLVILLMVFLVGCSNTFKSCHERCKDIELDKINPSCDNFLESDIIEKCGITKQQMMNYTEYCFERCIDYGK